MGIGALVGRWARASNGRAVENARTAATLCARRRVEAVEVELFLRERRGVRAVS